MRSVATAVAALSCAAPSALAAPRAAAARSALHVSVFRSPSANIGCVIGGGVARCDIRDRVWSPPRRPKSCPLDFGQGLFVARSGRGRFVCAGDTALNPTARALAYGTQTVVAGFRCSSARSGMTCSSLRTGHGFFISVQRYRRF
jgi:hypothetical protein